MANLFEITVGYSCNCNCRFCSVGHMRKELLLSTKQIKEKIVEAKKNNTSILGFGGGEPTIRKDIFELLRYAKKQGFKIIRIQTNGVMFSYEDFVDKIIDAGANFFKFSMHGHNPKLHDYLTQTPGSFTKAVKGIENLKSRGMSVEVNVVINKLNYKYLPQITEFFIKKGISKFVFIYPVYEGNIINNFYEMGVKMSEVAPYLRDSLDRINELNLDKGICMNIPRCVLSSGDGIQYNVVDRFDTTISTPQGTDDIDLSNKGNLIKPEECKKCFYKKKCMGLWRSYVDYFGLSEIKPIMKEYQENLKQ